MVQFFLCPFLISFKCSASKNRHLQRIHSQNLFQITVILINIFKIGTEQIFQNRCTLALFSSASRSSSTYMCRYGPGSAHYIPSLPPSCDWKFGKTNDILDSIFRNSSKSGDVNDPGHTIHILKPWDPCLIFPVFQSNATVHITTAISCQRIRLSKW